MNDTDPTTTAPNLPAVRPDEEVSELARRTDPSQADKTSEKLAAEKAKRGIVWVRPSELMSQASARAAGRGIDFHAELARRARRPAVQAVATSRRAISERARRLPPVSAFGRRGQSPSGATRSGVGLI